MHIPQIVAAGLAGCLLAATAAAQRSQPDTAPAGAPKEPNTKMLEAGAKVLQGNAPLAGFDIYLNGFHPMKDHPEMQVEAHHFCRQVNEDLAQCALFDGNTRAANLNGIEYIISEKLYAGLPAAERQYWHPHNGEILSGLLVAPGLPQAAEHALMKKKINSYGKTWHLWNTGANGKPGDSLPLGAPMLAWSFSRDGELLPSMLEERDTRMKVHAGAKRKQRADLKPLAHPQAGVDALKGRFDRPTQDIPGVADSAPAAR
jgi:hypothetical protein